MIKLIYASDLNGLIGKGDKLPWNIPSELAFFFEMTKQGTLLFGLNTFKSLPSNFQKQDRKIILSLIGLNNTEEQLLNLKNQADLIIYTEQEMLSLFLSFQNSKENLFICGGKEIYTRYYFEQIKFD
ncbi:Dihydrofolate reductase (plasmid) [Mycoplasmopsis gallopavonis]|uniref:dihydrofolate reductase n=1 Tax=Mycoplasmopsis gallopavonis TaxID=76629 RepID=A0A449B0E0_9BACT|nr:dihydrofolate reductase [Mycoplasmopsis gallopavonis]VEU73225.1 Dihydrofolate reductase [Mycoplasmopsis gallopavonis]